MAEVWVHQVVGKDTIAPNSTFKSTQVKNTQKLQTGKGKPFYVVGWANSSTFPATFSIDIWLDNDYSINVNDQSLDTTVQEASI